jgi:hypothetical protein
MPTCADSAVRLCSQVAPHCNVLTDVTCTRSQVAINDEMVDKLTPPETVDPTERRDILSNLAKALKKQGSFTLASKKYTQVHRCVLCRGITVTCVG